MSNLVRTLAVLAAVFALGCAAVAGAAADAAPAVRDVWFSITDGEQRYGYLNLAVRRLDDGNFEYAIASRMQVELLGTRQRLSRSATLVVAPDLRPLRLESEAVQMSGSSRLRGWATDDGFVIEIEHGGQAHRSTFSFGDEPGLIVDVTLSDWLQRRLHASESAVDSEVAAQEHRIRVLGLEGGEFTEVSARLVERGPHGSTWTVRSDVEWGESTLRLDAYGMLVDQAVRLPPLRIERSSPVVARAIDYRRIPDRELLVFTPDQALPPSARLRRVRSG